MRPFLAITGPTGVGKTALALDLAERLGAEIVSADSRQIYRGMDVGTATPTAAERARVRHHFVNERDPDEPITAGQFAREAEARIDGVLARGAVPLVVGGSMLYLDALVRGIADLPPVPNVLRDTLTAAAATADGRARLYHELHAADPTAAGTLDASKSHRLTRLVGLLRTAGPPSALWDQAPTPRHAFRVIALDRPRDELYARIERRVEAMLDGGLLDEVRRLMAAGYRPDRLPLRTIGYQEPAAFLEGAVEHDEMVRLLKRNTRRFAKRQLTWLRRYDDVLWVPADASPDEVLALVTEKSA